MKKILLDTHIFVLMITNENKLNDNARTVIASAVSERKLLLSAISIWEITMLLQKKRLQFSIPIRLWIERALTTPGVLLSPLSSEILMESCLLPGEIHGDPADQMIIATARIENATLMTRDTNILAYMKSENMSCIQG